MKLLQCNYRVSPYILVSGLTNVYITLIVFFFNLDPRIARKCIRVSTIQHGGVWVFANKKMCIGYPLSTDEFQILYAVIENCAILNDASDMFDELLELL